MVNATHLDMVRERLNQKRGCILSKDERVLLLNTEAPSWCEISTLDALVVHCIQEGSSPEKMVALLNTFSMVPEEAEQYIDRVLARVFKVLCAEPRPGNSGVTAYLHITDACNLSCRYCYTRSACPPRRWLDTHSWEDIITQVARVAHTAVFSGGEPLLRNDVFDLAVCAKAQGLTTTLLTNGTPITLENSSRIAQCFDSVQVSLDGPEPIHVRTRQEYHAADHGLQAMVTMSPSKVCVGITVTKENIDGIIPFIHSLAARGVRKVHLNLLKSVHSDAAVLQPSVERLSTLLNGLFDSSPLKITNFGHIVPPPERYCLNCGAGTSVISLVADGSVYPCEGLIRPSLCAGNVLETSLADCMEQSPVLRELKLITVDKIPGCRTCPLRYLCGGGCRADALISAATLWAKDTFCQVYRGLIESFMWKHKTWIL